jgi:hypothetical protein
MANPASITITECTANGGVNQPAVQTLDTAGMVPINLGGKGLDRVIIEAINTDDADATLTFKAAANPPGIQSKALVVTLQETGTAGDKQIIGPFDASRFVQGGADAGEMHVTLAGGASPTVTMRCYRLPKFV